MSLHHAAQQLAAQGRHGDDMLVHMNPKEVEGLQALAEQKGTSLTTNPETGLPEAFGLGSLNPVRIVQGKGEIGEALGPAAPILAGLALGPAGFNLMGAGMAGLTVGGITALASGNLAKGLSAGLGAYGGAALGAGLSGMGEASLASQAESANEIAAQTGVGSGASSATPSMMDKLGAGAEYAAKNPTEALKTLGEGSAWKGAGILGAAAAPILAGKMVQTATPPPQSAGLIRPYTFDRRMSTPANMVQASYQPGQDTSERNWFQDTFTAQTPYESPGPEYKKMAGGGPVEAMSNANAVGANTGYPQADIEGHAYATPWQTPVSQNVVHGAADTGVNRMTGEMNFAAGGITGEGNLDLHIPLDLGGSGVFGGGSTNGYQAAGSGTSAQTGFRGYNNAPGQSAGATRQDMSSFAPTQSADAFAQMAAAGQTGAPNSTTDAGAAAAFTGLGPIGNQAGLSSRLSNYVPDPTLGGGINLRGKNYLAQGGLARGGLSDLGGYAAGGSPRLLKGPGDGMSDNIPAVIGGKQPARLADGEFVVPADVVSHLGNGSTEAGAKQLYKMMDRIRTARTGKKKQAPEVKTGKYLPA